MKQKIRQMLTIVRELKRDFRATRGKEFLKSRMEADIIRMVHSIEKGLSIENPRKGFGVAKMKELFSLGEQYLNLEFDDNDCLYYILDGVSAYLKFHADHNFENEDVIKIKEMWEAFQSKLPEKESVYGGTEKLVLSDMDFNIEEIEKFFYTRHSVREFSGESVDDEILQKAITLAKRCPSACNRQGVRVYSVERDVFLAEAGYALEGVGGFKDDVDKFLIVTGKQSAYSINERNQYIVSASIFAAYLTLALHAYHVAACVVQRALTPQKYWIDFRKKHNIPEDEQIVLLIGIGKYKDKTKVPLSKRFDTDKIYRKL